MARPVKEIADAIARQDVRWLSTLPGIGATTAEQIVTTLKRKVTQLAVMSTQPAVPEPPPGAVAEVKPKASARRKAGETAEPEAAAVAVDGQVIDDVYQA